MEVDSVGDPRGGRADRKAIAAALALCSFLWGLKCYLYLWYRFAHGIDALSDAPLGSIFLIGGADLVLCATLALLYRAIDAGARWIAPRGGPTSARIVWFALHAAIVIFAVVSFEVNQVYSWPLDINHIRSADDPRIIRASLMAYAGIGPILFMLLGLICFPKVAPAVERVLERRRWLNSAPRLWGTLIVATLALGILWSEALAGYDTYGVKQDALLYFVIHYKRPASRLDASRDLERLDSQFANKPASTDELGSMLPQQHDLQRDFPLSTNGDGMNVVVIQMESTSAIYIDPVTTPNICQLARNGVSFRNHFTTCTRSDRATYALYYSDYLSELGTTPRMLYDRPMPQPALMEVFKNAGYATGLFHSSFLSYMDFIYLFEHKGLDTIVEASDTWDGHSQLPWSWGVREEDTVDALTKWIDQKNGQQFFAIYCTMFPHHPYVCPSDDKPYPETSWRNRYRDSLHYADSAVGRLVNNLKSRGLLESTIIAIVGDHGESVAAYPVGHGMRVSGEEIRTPFIVSNPILFPAGVESHVPTSHLDMAPTLASLAGLPAPKSWLGRDVSARTFPARAFYVTLPQRYDELIVDNGLLYVLSRRGNHSALSDLTNVEPVALADGDPRALLVNRYQHRVQSLSDWIEWRHDSRALARDATPPNNVARIKPRPSNQSARVSD